MAGPLLETKLYIPRLRRQLVSRPRLVQELARAVDSRLTLVSAPAGFGKTTLLAEWIAATPPDVATFAWLSIDEQDNNPGVFWAYVIAALRRAAPGSVVLRDDSDLSPEQGQPVQSLLPALINDLSTTTGDIVLVLDDYHLINLPEIHETMGFLIDHLPPALHVVIASRADPPLPLARLRARGELLELRAGDLRFQPEEAATYFNGTMDLGLAASDIDILEGRTEGWIAALQLAALSLKARDDASSFIEVFAGDNRYIVDYLVQEVLQRQPESVRRFLLQTSLLERLNGGLCDAITGRDDGEAMLRSLDQGNVFVVPLDDRREWYRYHHLFADVLRAHLLAEDPSSLQELHRRAGTWFAEHGDGHEAIKHALAAGDFSRAAGLIEQALPEMLRSRRDRTLRDWLAALPEAVLALRPVLCAGYVGVLLQTGEVELVDSLLQHAEQSLDVASLTNVDRPAPDDRPVFVDEQQFRELPGLVPLYRAGHAQVIGNLADTALYARLALDRLADDAPLRGGALALLGLALWSEGDLKGASATYIEGIERVHRGGYVNDSSTIMLADMRVAQGRLRDARSLYERALERAGELGNAAPRGTADLHVGISEICREQNDLGAALAHLSSSKALGEAAGLPENRYRWFTAMAAVSQSQSDLDGALDQLREAERLFAPGFSPAVHPIAALRARVWLLQGRLDDTAAWALRRGLTPKDDLSYLREFEHLTLARLLLARARAAAPEADPAELSSFLDRLGAAAESGGRTGSLIEVLVLKALASKAAELEAIQQALTLAEPQGYVRIFLDEGEPMLKPLQQVSKGAAAEYARRLLAAMRGAESRSVPTQSSTDHLSERELEVLRLLASDLSGPDIARELVVSLNTLRTHTKSIYTRLGVNSRREAVRRAAELKLL